MSYRRPFIEKPRPAARIAKSAASGPMSPSAPGVSRKPIPHPQHGGPMTWAEARDLAVLKKSDPDSKHSRLSVGVVVHWIKDDMLFHGKVVTFGARGARVVHGNGEALLDWSDIRGIGIHPAAQSPMQKSATWHAEQPVRETVLGRDDVAAGMFTEFLVSSPRGPRHAFGQIVGLGAHGATVDMGGARRVSVLYQDLKTAEWTA